MSIRFDGAFGVFGRRLGEIPKVEEGFGGYESGGTDRRSGAERPPA
jgi:hypothetical protein